MAAHQDCNASSNLVKLIPEIFETIAQNVEPADLFSMRLLCREAAVKVLRTYQSTHFTERIILLWDELGLEALVNIAEDKRFGPCLKKLTICVDTIDKPRPEDLQRGQKTPGWGLWRREWRRQERVRTRRIDLNLLAAAFTRLKEHVRHGLHIEITQAATLPYVPACCTILGETITDNLASDHVWGDRAVRVALEALARSRLRVESFSVHGEGEDGWAPWLGRLMRDSAPSLNASAVFQDLKFFRFVPWTTQDDITEWQANDFVASFCGSRQLKELQLEPLIRHTFPKYMANGEGNQELVGALLRTDFPALERLVLPGMRIDVDDFVDFVQRQGKLTSLEMRQVAFVGASGEHVRETDKGSENLVKQWTGLQDVSMRWCGGGQ